VVILGAGVVGLEVASSAAELGCSVEVLERGERLMARHLPPALSSHLADAHRSAGVKLRFGVETTAIERLRDGRFDVIGNFISEPANVIVAGVGMEPNIDLAAAQGLPVRRGIVVDAHGRTGCAGIYACGDVAEFYHERQGRHVHLESWQHATQHARSVASNMCGVSDVYAPTPWSWTDQHGLNIQMLGDASAADTTVLRGLPCSQRFVAYSLCEGRVVGATLVNQGRELRHCRALIESGATPDLEQLQDPSVDLRQLL